MTRASVQPIALLLCALLVLALLPPTTLAQETSAPAAQAGAEAGTALEAPASSSAAAEQPAAAETRSAEANVQEAQSAALTTATESAPSVTRDGQPKPAILKTNDIIETSLFTGAFSYAYPLDVPPGTAGLAPEVALAYSSQRATNPSVLGAGWDLAAAGFIQREYNQSVNATEPIYRLTLGGMSQTLVRVPEEGRFRAKSDPSLRIEYRQGSALNTKGTYWLVWTKDGTLYRFGSINASEQLSNLTEQQYRWHLDAIRDAHDNSVWFVYREDPFPSDTGATYLWNITYGPRTVNFTYEPIDRPDRRSSLADRHNASVSRRLANVTTLFNNSLVRAYALGYATIGNVSVLANITQHGSDGSALPPTRFSYTSPFGGWTSGSFQPPYWTDGWARVLDVNSDGRADFVRSIRGPPYTGPYPQYNSYDYTNSGDCSHPRSEVWLSNGTAWVQNASWSVPVCLDQRTHFTDLDADGLTDIVHVHPTYGESLVYRNNGSGWTASSEPWQDPIAPWSDPAFARFADVNNDGRPDALYSKDGNCNANTAIYLNNGTTWLSDNRSWSRTLCATLSEWSALTDVNGDGLVDVLHAESTNTGCGARNPKALLNNGTGWVSDPRWLPPLCLGQYSHFADLDSDGLTDIIGYENYRNTGSGWQATGNWSAFNYLDYFQLADLNGDGAIDALRSGPGSGRDHVSLNNATRSFLLRSIQTPLGGAYTVDYRSSAFLDNQQNKSRSSDLPFNLWLVRSVTRWNGLSGAANETSTTLSNYSGGLYDFREKEFRGFARSQEERPDNATIVRFFHQDETRAGREYRTDTIDARTNQTLERTERLWSVTANATPLGTLFTVTLAQENATTLLPFTNQSARTFTSYAWDNLSNPTATLSFGDPLTSADDRSAYTTYATNWSSWISVPARTALLAADNATLVRETNTSYDGRGPGEPPIRGDATAESRLLANATNPVTRMAYDSFGNLVNRTDPLDRSTLFAYESTGTFPVRTVNPAGHVTTASYDPGTGNVLSSTDANAQTTTFAYDALGRLLNETRPLDSAPTRNTTYALSGSAPSLVKTSQRTNATTARTGFQFLDGFGNAIQARQEAAGNQHIVTDTFFDALSRVRASANPVFAPANESYAPANLSIPRTRFSFDPLGRLNQTTNPDRTAQARAYALRNATLTDENRNARTEVRDAHGRITEVLEFAPLPQRTAYAYSATDELTAITDTEGNRISFAYDTLGRRTALSDPDVGTWNSTFDRAGNLIQQRDARGALTNLSYDALDRVTSRNATDLAALFAYDQTWNGTRSEAKLVDRTSGALRSVARTSYDARLRVTGEALTLAGTVLVQNFTYDSADRALTHALPGRTITYSYSPQGTLASLADGSPLLSLTSTAAGKPALRASANGLNTTFSYDLATQRLVRARTGALQDLSYAYDPAGNVRSIADAATGRAWQMTYDPLDRLASAARSDNGTQAYAFNYSYSPTGSLLSVSSDRSLRAYAYGARPAHAPASVTEQSPLSIDSLEALPAGNRSSALLLAVRNRGPSALEAVNWSLAFAASAVPRIPVGLLRPADASFLDATRDATLPSTLLPNQTLFLALWQQLPGDQNITFVTLPAMNASYCATQASWNTCSSTCAGEPQGTFCGEICVAQCECTFPLYACPTGYSCRAAIWGSAGRCVPTGIESTLPANVSYALTASVARNGSLAAIATGNLTPSANAATISPASSRSASTTAYSYDANGNRLSDGSLWLEYDGFNQLSRARSGSASGSVVEEYQYDAQGQRIQKYEPQTNQTTLYLGSAFVRVSNSSGTFDSFFYHAGSALLARRDPNNQTYFYHPDHLGSTSLVTNSTGAVVEDTTYEPFGSVFSGGSSRYLYTGKELDRSTGLEYYGARYYDPALGQFAQPDDTLPSPYDPQQLNRYAYARNNPYKYTDPDGHVINLVAGAVGAGLGALIGGLYAYATGGDVAEGALTGAVAGGIGGLTMGASLVLTAAGGVAAGEAAHAVENAYEGRDVMEGAFDPGRMAVNGLTAGAASKLGGAAQKGASAAAERLGVGGAMRGAAEAGEAAGTRIKPLYNAESAAHVVPNHVDSLQYAGKSKFVPGLNMQNLANEIASNGQILPNRNSYIKIGADMGRQVGTRGETCAICIVNPRNNFRVVTQYPVKKVR